MIIHDAKGQIKWPGFRRFTKLSQLIKAANSGVTHLIYAPVYAELVDETEQEAFFRFVYLRRKTFLYIDEVYGVTRGDQFPLSLGAIVTRGRELGIACLIATQRPARIPMILLSEAERYWIFRLNLPQDRKRMEELTGCYEDVIGSLEHKRFLFHDVTSPGFSNQAYQINERT